MMYNEQIKDKYVEQLKQTIKGTEGSINYKIKRTLKLFRDVSKYEEYYKKDVGEFSIYEFKVSLNDILFAKQVNLETGEKVINILFEYLCWYAKYINSNIIIPNKMMLRVEDIINIHTIKRTYYKNPAEFLDTLLFLFNRGKSVDILSTELIRIVYFVTMLLIYNGVDVSELKSLKIENMDFDNKIIVLPNESISMYEDFIKYYKYVCEHRSYNTHINSLSLTPVVDVEYIISVPNTNLDESFKNAFNYVSKFVNNKELLDKKEKQLINKEAIVLSGLFYRMYVLEQQGKAIQDIYKQFKLNDKTKRNNKFITIQYNLFKEAYYDENVQNYFTI